jgi:hypothetical protein
LIVEAHAPKPECLGCGWVFEVVVPLIEQGLGEQGAQLVVLEEEGDEVGVWFDVLGHRAFKGGVKDVGEEGLSQLLSVA